LIGFFRELDGALKNLADRGFETQGSNPAGREPRSGKILRHIGEYQIMSIDPAAARV